MSVTLNQEAGSHVRQDYSPSVLNGDACNLLVIGSAEEARPVLVAREKDGRKLSIVAYMPVDSSRLSANGSRHDFYTNIEQILDQTVVDEVLVAGRVPHSYVDRIGDACVRRGLAFSRLVNLPEATFGRSRVSRLNSGSYLLSMDSAPHGRWRLMLKRFVDVIGAILGLCLCGLVYLLSGASIKRQSAGSVIFRQVRVGRNGRSFVLFKFRTMFADAEARLTELLGQNHMRGCMFKMIDDPRIIPIGKILRRSHLDELPQFWNVLRGEMSLVGPRPPTPNEVASYSSHHRRRLSMKPGITGLWQIKGNNMVSDFEEIVRLDCAYIDNWSLWLDFKILCGTISKAFHATGW
jgi:exopolysaccharide biosynthesis polyprenyl glycosylphosphotransferase